MHSRAHGISCVRCPTGPRQCAHDELVAATYVAAQLRAYGIDPAGDDGGYLQKAPLVQPKFNSAPALKFSKPAAGTQAAEDVVWTHGKEMLVLYLSKPEFAGPLARMDSERRTRRFHRGRWSWSRERMTRRLQGAVSNAVSQGRGRDCSRVGECESALGCARTEAAESRATA